MIKVSIHSHVGVKPFLMCHCERCEAISTARDCHVADAPRNDNSGAGASLCPQ